MDLWFPFGKELQETWGLQIWEWDDISIPKWRTSTLSMVFWNKFLVISSTLSIKPLLCYRSGLKWTGIFNTSCTYPGSFHWSNWFLLSDVMNTRRPNSEMFLKASTSVEQMVVKLPNNQELTTDMPIHSIMNPISINDNEKECVPYIRKMSRVFGSLFLVLEIPASLRIFPLSS